MSGEPITAKVCWQEPLRNLPLCRVVERSCGGPLLVGDVGGTRTLLQISELRPRNYRVWSEASYATGSYRSLAAMIREFMSHCGVDASTLFGAAIAVTGVVDGNRVASSRLREWIGSADALAELLGLPYVHLVNDVLALSYGLLALAVEDRIPIQDGTPRPGRPVVLVSVGSGLGQSVVVGSGSQRVAVGLEAGQSAFAPRSEREIALWRYMRRDGRTLCWEQVLSEPGLTSVARFVADRLGTGSCPRLDSGTPRYVQVRDLATYAEAPNSCSAVSCIACNAAATIDLFSELLGQYVASLAISFVAEGGVLLSGGVTQVITSRLAAPFLRGFHQDGSLAYLLRRTPVAVACNLQAGPLGAAISIVRGGK